MHKLVNYREMYIYALRVQRLKRLQTPETPETQ